MFTAVDIGVDELDAWPDALLDLYERRIDLMIVRGVFSAEQCERAVQRLFAEPRSWTLQETADPEQTQLRLLGESLTPYQGHPNGPEMAHYHDKAAAFDQQCRELFGGGPAFLPRVTEVLEQLSGGRSLHVPRSEDGRAYTYATVRTLPVGCQIPLHVGNYFLDTGGYAWLRTLVSLEDQLSYFVMLQTAETGGELEVYDLEWGDPDTPWLEVPGVWDARRIVGHRDSRFFSPHPGDLLLFDGGRYYHRVSPVSGERTRVTIGGFLGFSNDFREVLIWN